MNNYIEEFDNTAHDLQADFYDNLNRSEKEAEIKLVLGNVLSHKHQKGLTIQLLSKTEKGFKVRQTEIYSGWTDRKFRKPKSKMAFYSESELKELFKNGK